ncbi:hypothetical protein BCR41DRAFT_368217 [Lobosporangium transversale]|uniref:Uncharacterized protein n=1 Tax=Lobosporangium transversale TaxID=64571 RepID=A0A1Y2GWN4_9FUNG|nr:hypothetical protein BCR41DRAFT_368217 [Lobosporangium transversale]ORZ26675.1 hypothetical protein BCR41DRAFT_368217 [Lobosporangium transversale]|eukprot:XP_021884438.1 hypothetical protein BCR41DRAFT_368217 [Lobosporangium transversale]
MNFGPSPRPPPPPPPRLEYLEKSDIKEIDWKDYVPLEMYHSLDYDPHQGHRVIAIEKEALFGGFPVDSPRALTISQQPQSRQQLPATHPKNPILTQALEPFHIRDIIDWKADYRLKQSADQDLERKRLAYSRTLDSLERYEDELQSLNRQYTICLRDIQTSIDRAAWVGLHCQEDAGNLTLNTLQICAGHFQSGGPLTTYDIFELSKLDLELLQKSIEAMKYLKTRMSICRIKLGLTKANVSDVQDMRSLQRFQELHGEWGRIYNEYNNSFRRPKDIHSFDCNIDISTTKTENIIRNSLYQLIKNIELAALEYSEYHFKSAGIARIQDIPLNWAIRITNDRYASDLAEIAKIQGDLHRAVTNNELEANERLKLFRMASDLSKYGHHIHSVKNIKSPIALRILDTPRVCRIQKMKVDFASMAYRGMTEQDRHQGRMNPVVNTMPLELWYAMSEKEEMVHKKERLHSIQQSRMCGLYYDEGVPSNSEMDMDVPSQPATASNNDGTVQAVHDAREYRRVLEILKVGQRILARNLHTLEILVWNGPSCAGCESVNGGELRPEEHQCNDITPYPLEIIPPMSVPQATQQGHLAAGPGSAKTSILTHIAEHISSRLAHLKLHFWKVSRKSFQMLLENLPHLVILEMKECLTHIEDGPIEGPVFKHKGVKLLAISLTTLFDRQWHCNFRRITALPCPHYPIDDDDDGASNDGSIGNESNYGTDSDEDSSGDRELNETEWTDDTESPTGPNDLDDLSLQSALALDDSLFEHFPNLEHWKLNHGADNARLIPWVGAQVRKHCPRLDKLTLTKDSGLDSNQAALLVHVFRPAHTVLSPPPLAATEVKVAFAQTLTGPIEALDDEGDLPGPMGSSGYMIGNGLGLTAFKAENTIVYGLPLIRALKLHTKTLQVLDIDANNVEWVPERWVVGAGWRNNVASTVLPSFDAGHNAHPSSGAITLTKTSATNDTNTTINTGASTVTAPVHFSIPPASPVQEDLLHPGSLTLQSSAIPTVPQGLRGLNSDAANVDPISAPEVRLALSALLQQFTRLRVLKLPEARLPPEHIQQGPLWGSVNSLERVWLQFNNYNFNTLLIPYVMHQLDAVYVPTYYSPADQYIHPEGVLPLTPLDFDSKSDPDVDVWNDMLPLPETPHAVSFSDQTSSSTFQKYMDRYLGRCLGQEKLWGTEQPALPSEQPPLVDLHPIFQRSVEEMIAFLRQFPRLQYIWLGDGLYRLSP